MESSDYKKWGFSVSYDSGGVKLIAVSIRLGLLFPSIIVYSTWEEIKRMDWTRFWQFWTRSESFEVPEPSIEIIIFMQKTSISIFISSENQWMNRKPVGDLISHDFPKNNKKDSVYFS